MEVISQLVLFRYEPKLILMLLCDDESAKKEKKKLMMMNDLVGRYFLHGKKKIFYRIFYTTVKKNTYIDIFAFMTSFQKRELAVTYRRRDA